LTDSPKATKPRPIRTGKPHKLALVHRHGNLLPLVIRAGQLLEMRRPGMPGSAVSQNLDKIARTDDGWLIAHWRTEKCFHAFAEFLNEAYAETGGRCVQHFVGNARVWDVLDAHGAGRPPKREARAEMSDPEIALALAILTRRERDGDLDPIGIVSITMRGDVLAVDWQHCKAMDEGRADIEAAWARLGRTEAIVHSVGGVAC